MQILVQVFKHIDLVPLFKRNLRVFFVEQIIPVFVVNFEIRNIKVEIDISVLVFLKLKSLE
mgnify:CR=1 FL=1